MAKKKATAPFQELNTTIDSKNGHYFVNTTEKGLQVDWWRNGNQEHIGVFNTVDEVNEAVEQNENKNFK